MIDHPSILIATLASASQLSREAFRLHRNAHFAIAAYDDSTTDGNTRESTPAIDLTESTIYITTNHEPYEVLEGFVFGSVANDEEIDIVLSDVEGGTSRGVGRSSTGVSRKHFSLCYNWETRGFILVNHSKYGTEVKTTTGMKMLNDRQTVSLTSGDTIQAGTAAMRITYPRRDSRSGSTRMFDSNWMKLYRKWQQAVPQAARLGLNDSALVTRAPSMELELQKQIGHGATAIVFKAVDVSGSLYAVKVPKNPECRELILAEIRAMERLQHPNIVTYFADKIVVERSKHYPSPYIVLEYAEYGSLKDCWKILSTLQIEAIFMQLFDAIRHSHSIGLAHHDLKPDNVLVFSTSPIQVKIADFGFAEWGPWDKQQGTPQYIAPEVMRYPKAAYTSYSDIWSLGMMLLEVSIRGDLPMPVFWDEVTRGYSASRNQSSALWEDFFIQCSTARPKQGWEHLISIAQKMLVENPHARPTAEGCALLLDGHRKTVIRRWISVDRRRRSRISVCLSALLEYGGLPFGERQEVLRKMANDKESSFENPYTSSSTSHEAGLYVASGRAQEVVHKYTSSLSGILQQVLKEHTQSLA